MGNVTGRDLKKGLVSQDNKKQKLTEVRRQILEKGRRMEVEERVGCVSCWQLYHGERPDSPVLEESFMLRKGSGRVKTGPSDLTDFHVTGTESR